MSASYDPTLPTALDRARFRLGDTTVDPESSALLPDETYSTLLAANATENEAIAQAADALAARYGQEPDQIGLGGEVTIRWGDRVKTWQALAKVLRGQDTAATAATGTALAQIRPHHRHHRDDHDYSEYHRDLILSEGTWYSN